MSWAPSAALLALQADYLADDVPLEPAMETWAEAAIVAYLESGGSVRPALAVAGAPDEQLQTLLTDLGFERLCETLASTTLSALRDAMDDGRPALLSQLKDAGVASLADRQKLSNELAKAHREGRLEPGASTAAAAPLDGETAAAARRRLLAPLPPHRRLAASAMGSSGSASPVPGEWFGLRIPRTFVELASERAGFGASWLTRALRSSLVLDKSNSVLRILSMDELPLQGDEAQGGAGIKAILRVEYASPSASLHTSLFCKLPWPVSGHAHASPKWRAILSSHYGDGDGRELSVYVLAEDLMPVRVPKLYFADLSRATADYVLLTECVPYGAADPSRPGVCVLAKCGKYQDDRLPNAHEYYFAFFRAIARIAAADKRGRFEPVLPCFVPATVPAAEPADTPVRRDMSRRWAKAQCVALREFATMVAPHLFPRRLCSAAFLDEFEAKVAECAGYFDAAKRYASRDPNYSGLTHPNLQIDNGYFWTASPGGTETTGDGTLLEAGLLDWYNCQRAPFAAIMMGCLSGAEPAVLAQHIGPLVRCFVDEYAKEGGPQIDAGSLLLQFQLMFVHTLVGSLTFIASDIYLEGPPRAEWASVHSKDDPRVMGRWNVRCRTVAILQQLAFWDIVDLHAVFVRFGEDCDAERTPRTQ